MASSFVSGDGTIVNAGGGQVASAQTGQIVQRNYTYPKWRTRKGGRQGTGRPPQTGQDAWTNGTPSGLQFPIAPAWQTQSAWNNGQGMPAPQYQPTTWQPGSIQPPVWTLPASATGQGQYAPVTITHGTPPPMTGYTPATAPLPKWKTKRSPQTFGQWVNNPPTTPFLTVTNPAPAPKTAPTPIIPTSNTPVYDPFSSHYKGYGGGGGGGYERTPSWLQNLYNWNFKG